MIHPFSPFVWALLFLLASLTQVNSSLNPKALSSQSQPIFEYNGFPKENPGFFQFYFNQYSDHFNYYSRPDLYLQRFLVNDTFWDPEDGVIFFYCGNEGDIEWFWNNTGFMFDIAPQFGALIVFAEHRYYGESWPIPEEKAHINGNSGLLSVEQALADYAELLEYLQLQIAMTSPEDLRRIWREHDHKGSESKKPFSKTDLIHQNPQKFAKIKEQQPHIPVIGFGGSYGGMLAGWFRLHYPSVVDGVLASSAPIPLASDPEVRESPEFWELVTTDWETVDEQCPDLVREGFNQIFELSSQGESGYNTLKEIFSLCYLDNEDDIEELILWTVNAFGYLAMGDYPYSAEFLGSLPAWPVNVSCSYLVNNKDQPIYGIAQTTSMYYNSSGDLACFDMYEEFISCADPSGCGTGSEGKSWDYQACTEIIYFPSTNNVTDMFPPREWGPTNSSEYCYETWGIKQRFDWTLTSLGGTEGDFAESSRIIFSNGALDPWSIGGFTKDISESVVAILIPQAAHHLDLRSANPNDPESVVSARQMEVEIIRSWIDDLKKSEL